MKEETKRKISAGLKKVYASGKRIHAFKGKTLSLEHRKNISKGGKGKIRTPEQRENMSRGLKGNKCGVKTYFKSGSQHWNWKGGKCLLMTRFRTSRRYKELRNEVFKADNYTCRLCGDRTRKGHRILIQLDHIIPVSYYVQKYGLTTLEETMKCVGLWDRSNLRTLCVPCHEKTDTYGNKATKWLKKLGYEAQIKL